MMNLISKLFLMFWMFVSSGDMTPEYYFSSWEASGACGMFFVVDDYYLTFSKGEACALHEVGHIADCENRDCISQSPEFEQATIDYIARCEDEEQPCWRINYYYEQGQLGEVYAELYMWDILYSIPHEFEVFYVR